MTPLRPTRLPPLVLLSFTIGCAKSPSNALHADASAGADAALDGETGSLDGAPPPVSDGGICTVAANCLGHFTIPGSTYQLPYYSTFPIGSSNGGNASVTRIVVFNQGLDRDADTDFSTMVAAAQLSGQLDQTLVITAHFEALVSTDGSACTGNADSPLPNDLVWTCDAWSDGLAAVNDPSITSYGALDSLLAAAIASSPNVTEVTVSGFSAGGQLTQRYVAANRSDKGATGPTFRYVVGDPSSYLYFDDRRPTDAGGCTVTGCPGGFAAFADIEDASACPDYNDWKYGTDGLLGAAAAFTASALESAYASRNVTYLLGMLDNGPTTVADYSQLDVTCPAEAEGPYRYQRGLAFYAYATGLLDAGTSRLFTVPGCGHSPTCVFESDAGVAAVFGE